MFKWIEEYREANSQTKYFILNWLIYGIVIIVTTAYCYGRLDFVRSDKAPPAKETQQASDKK